MSASDSEYSIDWLASDDEDSDSELEPDCTKVQGQTTLPKSPSSRVIQGAQTCQSFSKRNGDKGEVMDKENMSSRGSSPSSCDSTDYSEDGGHSHLGQETRTNYSRCPESPVGKKRQTLKRTRSSMVPEQRERQLTPEQMEKDRLFACKCLELQCYIHPLSSILNGLRSGRYRERLSTFQESVAMDRIQRIMGVLQNPCMGERYVNIILKMEEMLKNWFPHIKHQRSDQANTAALMEETTLSKKPKLSPSTSPLLTGIANPATTSALFMGNKAMRVSDLTPPGPYSATNLKWLHTSPICSLTAEQALGTVRNFLIAHRDRDTTQDNSVSSSTDHLCKTESAPSRPRPAKINAPCLERLLKSTESIITQKGPVGLGGMAAGGWS
ncbi:circadian-associated transcriptional repressor [Sinocyclocheilus anshuiensis]|uniref:Circadian-associated transcriptional repressor-like n=1 Tax=Sinocyclocheilus anshuiensis TaxID=1608454 RepID=A0A671NFM7_9TELE|nr:PREDICTED: circadian-associated transcriptional repressor-like [Sinocyclocheilus anshuiensis]XP_016354797.1 PREDICTED: circadian-associated transcriptional repressor-like [Sinocyclocheilus anshuiensis]